MDLLKINVVTHVTLEATITGSFSCDSCSLLGIGYDAFEVYIEHEQYAAFHICLLW
jgi:hypothetical protein